MNQLADDLRYGFVNRAATADKKYNPRLICNNDAANMFQALREEIKSAKSFIFSVAFIAPAALAMLKEDFLQFPGSKTIITSNYLDFNEPAMFRELLEIDGLEVFVYPHDNHRGFHPKGYLFRHDNTLSAIVGSANLTQKALQENEEWNLHFSSSFEGDITYQIETAIAMQRDRCVPLTHQWVDEYERKRAIPERPPLRRTALNSAPITANRMQQVALSNIQDLRQAGERKGLVISATGTGKTILAALAAKEARARRILFVAHREQILEKTKKEFQRVLAGPDSDFGLFVGKRKDINSRHLFASIQSLNSRNAYKEFPADTFDYIIVDEVHRGVAASYKPVFEYFQSKFMLGLTATPERPDSVDIFNLFDFNVPYEIRLQAALDADMLAPFHYFGVTDFSDDVGSVASDMPSIKTLVNDERIDYILEKLRVYGFPQGVKGLMFCSRRDEAKLLSTELNKRALFGRRLRTKVLLGEDSISKRNAVIEELAAGRIDYIITVDVFNEGIDIPAINQIVMLRETQSCIVFTQQLGRGLRKSPDKDHLRVIDFIGNYRNNFLIPMALFGDTSRNKSRLKHRVIDSKSMPLGSSVSFDEISREKVLKAIETASLDTIAEFKKDVQLLQYRLNKLPRLIDFVRFDTVDPTVISTTRTSNYWELLFKIKKAEYPPSTVESSFLEFLSKELLPGKQPQELILLQYFIKEGTLSRRRFIEMLDEKLVSHSPDDISVVERVLSLTFYPKKFYNKNPLITFDADTLSYSLSPTFLSLYNNWDHAYPHSFREHVDDIIETGLLQSRENGYWLGKLRRNHDYSRKDVSRLLGLKSDQTGTLNGYKIDTFSRSIPIFVNYKKQEGISASIAYKDQFIDRSTMRWFTRTNRTLACSEVQSIIQREYPIHLFVRRDDIRGEGFRYLGKVTPSDATQTTMPGNNGNELNVVSMNLNLEYPVPDTFYEYLHAGNR